jgi:hypothetical protein
LPILLYKWGPRAAKITTSSSTLLTKGEQDWLSYY